MARVGATIAANAALLGAGVFLLVRRFVRLDSGDLHLLALLVVIAFPLGLGGVAALRTRRRIVLWARYQAGRCPHCGYDLRATPVRCPECGRKPWKPVRPWIWKGM